MKKRILCLACALSLLGALFSGCGKSVGGAYIRPQFQSKNLMEGAKILSESLKKGEKADAARLLEEGRSAWTPRDLQRKPAKDQPDECNSAVEIELKEECTFNTALIEEDGSEVQYFRLQAWVDDAWKTVYQSEKIESMRLMSFDPVTTRRVRLSIDKFRSGKTPARIKSLQLYNEPKRDAQEFQVTAYQRLDGDVPSEILKRSEKEVKNYARYYDVYNTVLVFGAVNWKEGRMVFNFDDGEAGFARELAALRSIIAKRSNQSHQVKIICTALADGAGGDGHTGVNVFMKDHWQTVADQMVEFMKKYDLDGLDVDWEYPQSKEDWKCYDQFMARLDDGMQQVKSGAVLSAALSAWGLGMSGDTLKRIDQIQFMAYDGNDEDGFQSSLEQAESGLQAFVKNGADIKQINIGIAAYGRPLNSAPYWAAWREMEGPNLYWNNKLYNVECAGQVFDGTFCAPALAGDKTAYALLSGAGGVMVFRVACDKTMDDPNAVACGIENTLKRYVNGY